MRLIFLFFVLSITAYGQNCRKSTVYFNLNKHRSEKLFLEHIDSVLARFHPDTTYLFEIHGHTDELGSEFENLKLAAERIQFVQDYVVSKKLKNVRILTQNHGEKDPVSNDAKENRRVNIFTFPINPDGTITILSENGNRAKFPVNYFNKCGYCTTKPSLKLTDEKNDKQEEGVGIYIESNCEKDIECYSVEFRFPYELFNSPAKIKIPRPIYIRRCADAKIVFGKDSVALDSNYYNRFQISFDTVRNEYVVTHDCYYPHGNICCGGTTNRCIYRNILLNDSLTDRRTAHFFKYQKWPFDKIIRDSTIILGDQQLVQKVYCSNIEERIFGLGVFKELLFMNKPIDQLRKIPIFDKNHFFLYYDLQIQVKDYGPLKYLNSKLSIKIPKDEGIEQVGFYIEALDYFIPIEQAKNGRYVNKILDYPYSFGLKKGDKIISVGYTKPKKKYSKRKKVLKVKIKTKHLKQVGN